MWPFNQLPASIIYENVGRAKNKIQYPFCISQKTKPYITSSIAIIRHIYSNTLNFQHEKEEATKSVHCKL